jgi:hypothetical protein
MLSNLRFNTEIVASKPVSIPEVIGGTALFHSESYGDNPKLEDINRIYTQKVASHFDSKYRDLPSDARKNSVSSEVKKLLSETDQLLSTVEAAFPMTPQEQTTFQLMYTAMRGLNILDPNALLRAGQMYDAVVQYGDNNLFKKNSDLTDPIDNYQSSNKWAVLTGRWGNLEFDSLGRSSLIPAFLALSAVSPDVQETLKKVPLPVSPKNEEGTLDARLENLAADGLDKLNATLAGQQGSEADVAAVMQAVQQTILRVADERKSFMSITAEQVGSRIDWVNERAADFLEKGSDAVYDKAKAVEAATNNEFVKTAAKGAKVLAGVANRRVGNELAENFTGELNRKGKTPDFVRSLVNDIIGRTENNAPIFDLIKQVRTWVQQRRQEFREHLPIAIAKQFTRELTEDESGKLFAGVAKTDFSSLHSRYTFREMLDLLKNPQNVGAEISKLEGELFALQPDTRTQQILVQKSRQLATYMNTGIAGTTLLRNAEAISAMLDERTKKYKEVGNQVDVIDHLVSLYALQDLPVETKETLSQLADKEAAGVQYVMAYLEGQRSEELRKTVGRAHFNHYKGYIPTEATKEGSLIVARDSEAVDLAERSYVRVAAYGGSSIDQGAEPKSYFYSPVSARATYQQGVLQTVQQTAGGVDRSTGYTHGREVSGVVEDYNKVSRMWRSRKTEQATEHVLPVFDSRGSIIAYERTVSPEQLGRLELSTDIAKNMGVWAGRQVEEEESQEVNRLLIRNLKNMYDKDIADTPNNQDQYIDLFDTKEVNKDKVLVDMMNSIPGHTLSEIASVFGDNFYVRRDMLNDSLGYRDASVRNFWDGQSRLDPKILKASQDILKTTFGNKAFQYAVQGEEILKNVVTDLRVLVVVKSVLVPAANLTWNVFQLATRGVPLNSIRKGFPRKTAEVSEYLKTRDRLIELEAQRRAAGSNIIAVNKLEAEIQAINDRHRNLSIWPLIEAGEFTSISDGMLSKDDLALSQGRLTEYFEKLVDRLPDQAKTFARYGFITRDTALFRGLQRAIEYGDFLGKAVLYDDLTVRQNKSQDEALAAVTEEFVNYDRLPGRTRGYLEQVGLLWFWHFKLRSIKVGVSMLRNNPVHALLVMNAPVPDILGPLGSPITDNAISVIADDRAGYSIGPGMGMRAPQLNPWWNLIN